MAHGGVMGRLNGVRCPRFDGARRARWHIGRLASPPAGGSLRLLQFFGSRLVPVRAMTRWKYATQEWGRTTSWAAVSGKEGLDAMLAAHGEEGWELTGTAEVRCAYRSRKRAPASG